MFGGGLLCTHLCFSKVPAERLSDTHYRCETPPWPHMPARVEVVWGNHLSDTTCLTQVSFKHGESCSKLLVILTTTNNT